MKRRTFFCFLFCTWCRSLITTQIPPSPGKRFKISQILYKEQKRWWWGWGENIVNTYSVQLVFVKICFIFEIPVRKTICRTLWVTVGETETERTLCLHSWFQLELRASFHFVEMCTDHFDLRKNERKKDHHRHPQKRKKKREKKRRGPSPFNKYSQKSVLILRWIVHVTECGHPIRCQVYAIFIFTHPPFVKPARDAWIRAAWCICSSYTFCWANGKREYLLQYIFVHISPVDRAVE